MQAHLYIWSHMLYGLGSPSHLGFKSDLRCSRYSCMLDVHQSQLFLVLIRMKINVRIMFVTDWQTETHNCVACQSEGRKTSNVA